MTDLRKPNHYRHDSLGDPHVCQGDHNHPEKGTSCPDCGELHPFRCDRCERELVGVKEIAGILFVTVGSPIMPNDSPPTMLCYECGGELAEWMLPSLKDDPEYQKAKAAADEFHREN